MTAGLSEALTFATLAHEGAVDRAGAPYILHPLRVMLRVDTAIEQVTALLHDVVEDTDYSLDFIRQLGFPDEVITALDALTHRKGESYFAFILRVRQNPLAVKVKLADLTDNLDPARSASLGTLKDRYEEAVDTLTNAWRRPRLMAYHYYIVDHDAPARVDTETLTGEMLGEDGKWRPCDALRIQNDGYEVSKAEAMSFYDDDDD